jgi:hypothetical protein
MRKYLMICSFICFCQSLFAQTQLQIDTWLFGLPIEKRPNKIRKVMLKNTNFKEDINVYGTFKWTKSTFRGSIVNPNLPIPGAIDSARIVLNIGTLNLQDIYTGKMKWIRIEYYSYDTIFLNEVYKYACNQFSETSIKQKPTGHKTQNEESIGRGLEFSYKLYPNEYKTLSASRVKYKTGKQSIMIIYSSSDR